MSEYSSTSVTTLQNNGSVLNAFVNQVNQTKTVVDKLNAATKEIPKTGVDIKKGLGGAIDVVGKKIQTLIKDTHLFKNSLKTLWEGIKEAGNQQEQLSRIQVLVGNEDLGSDIYKYISDFAKTSVLSRGDLVKGFSTFQASAQDMGDMNQLFQMVERLTAKAPDKTPEQAIQALNEALSGNTASMSSQFGIQMSSDAMKGFIGSGDVGGGLDYMDQQMQRFGATQELVETRTQSLSGQLAMLSANFKDSFGAGLVSSMQPILDVVGQLQTALDSGQFQPLFDMIANGVAAIAKGVLWLSKNLNWVMPIIGMVAGALIGFQIATALASAFNAFFALSNGAAAASLGILNTAFVASAWWLLPLLGLVAGGALIFNLFNDSKKKSVPEDPDSGLDMETPLQDPLDQLNSQFANPEGLDVNIGNTSPVAVSGDVKVEEDNLSYLMDLANRDYIAKFSTASLAPQLNVSVGQVNETADINGITQQLTMELNSMIDNEAQGVYQ